MTGKRSLTVLVVSDGHMEALSESLSSLSQHENPHGVARVIILMREQFQIHEFINYLQNRFGRLSLDFVDMAGRHEDMSWDEVNYKMKGSYVVFLYEGDTVSPEYLSILSSSADEGIVPVARIIYDAGGGVSPISKSAFNHWFLKGGGGPIVEPAEDLELLHSAAGKLIPRAWLGDRALTYALNEHGFRFNLMLGLENKFAFSKMPAAMGACYYLTSADGKPESAVESHRLNEYRVGIDLLYEYKNDSTENRVYKFLVSVTSAILRRVPSDSADRKAIKSKIIRDGLSDAKEDLLDTSTNVLAVVANFAPYAGTAGIVAAKRIIENNKSVDLISAVVEGRVKQDSDLALTASYVREHYIYSPGIRGTNDSEIKAFIDYGLSKFKEWLTRGAQYNEMYSRAMVPHSHFLAAAIKCENPGIRWIAEFSDPLSLTVEGKSRGLSFDGCRTINHFTGWGSLLEQRLLLDDLRIYRWAELLPYFFADQLIFTNANQLKIMLEDAPPSHRRAIIDKAIIKHHPTLAYRFYQIESAKFETADTQTIDLAYFGDFHNKRGLGEIVEALELLEDEALERFRLIIFTNSSRKKIHNQVSARVNDRIVLQPKVGYLEFLATLDKVDVLIVNDSITEGYFTINPFLPSKVSDYRGSGTPIWAIIEPKSVMSTMYFDYTSKLGDTPEALSVLNTLLHRV